MSINLILIFKNIKHIALRKNLLYLSVLINLVLGSYILLNNFFKVPNTNSDVSTEHLDTPIVDERGFTLDTVNIVMLGNSITYQGNWHQVLKRKDVFNGGKPGWTTEQISWVIKNFVVPNKPKLCFFKGGTNDYILGIPTKRITSNMMMIMDSIASVGTYPVYTTTLYEKGNSFKNKQIDSLNFQMAEFCAIKGYDFLDLRPFLCSEGDIMEKYVQDDNIHLMPEAYPIWGEAMQTIIQKYGL